MMLNKLVGILAVILAVSVAQAQDNGYTPTTYSRPSAALTGGRYEAIDIEWERSGEWTEKEERGRSSLSTGAAGSSLSTTVKGLWVMIWLSPEYGGGETYIRLGACEMIYIKAESARDIVFPILLTIEGNTTLKIQSGSGRTGVEAIEVFDDPQSPPPTNITLPSGLSSGRNTPWKTTTAPDCITPTPEQAPSSTPVKISINTSGWAVVGLALVALVGFGFLYALADASGKKKNGS